MGKFRLGQEIRHRVSTLGVGGAIGFSIFELCATDSTVNSIPNAAHSNSAAFVGTLAGLVAAPLMGSERTVGETRARVAAVGAVVGTVAASLTGSTFGVYIPLDGVDPAVPALPNYFHAPSLPEVAANVVGATLGALVAACTVRRPNQPQ